MAARKSDKGASQPARNEADIKAAPAAVVPHYDVSFEFAMDCQLITNRQGIIGNVNHAGLKFLQTEKAFLLGKPMGLLFTEATTRNFFYDHLTKMSSGIESCSFQSLLTFGRNIRNVLVIGIASSPKEIRWVIHETTPLKEVESARVYLLRQLIMAQTNERRRLARDLHDNVGQLLTGLTFALEAFERGAALTESSRQALALATDATRQLRRAIHEITLRLRSSLLEEANLVTGLLHLTSEWQARDASTTLTFHSSLSDETHLPREIETNVYSIVQEALTNIFRHARAEHASVELSCAESTLIAKVNDDGVGFDTNLVAHQSGLGRLGLVGMRERAALVGGAVEVYTAPGKGTHITVRVPIPKDS